MERHLETEQMSTLIQFRVSGEDEKSILNAARFAGMRPAEYVRHSAKLAANRPDAALARIEERLIALEERLDGLSPTNNTQHMGPSAQVNGIEADALIKEIRREVRTGFNAILALLDGEALPDIPHSQASPDRPN